MNKSRRFSAFANFPFAALIAPIFTLVCSFALWMIGSGIIILPLWLFRDLCLPLLHFLFCAATSSEAGCKKAAPSLCQAFSVACGHSHFRVDRNLAAWYTAHAAHRSSNHNDYLACRIRHLLCVVPFGHIAHAAASKAP